jgi:hypothetical protein
MGDGNLVSDESSFQPASAPDSDLASEICNVNGHASRWMPLGTHTVGGLSYPDFNATIASGHDFESRKLAQSPRRWLAKA